MRTLKVAGWEIDTFTYAADLIEKRLQAGKPTPIAVARKLNQRDKKDPQRFNLLLGKSSVTLVPQMVAPTDSFGFGEIVAPDAAWITTGSIACGPEIDASRESIGSYIHRVPSPCA